MRTCWGQLGRVGVLVCGGSRIGQVHGMAVGSARVVAVPHMGVCVRPCLHAVWQCRRGFRKPEMRWWYCAACPLACLSAFLPSCLPTRMPA